MESIKLPSGWHPMGVSFGPPLTREFQIAYNKHNLLGVAASTNYGLKGRQGAVFVADLSSNNHIVRHWDVPACMLDVQLIHNSHNLKRSNGDPIIVVGAGSDGCLYTSATGLASTSLIPQKIHSREINRLRTTTNSFHHATLLASASWDQYAKVHQLQMDNGVWKEIAAFKCEAPIMEAAFNPINPLLACATLDSSVKIFDIYKRHLVYNHNKMGNFLTIDWSTDGRLLAFAGTDSVIQVIDPRNYQKSDDINLTGHFRSIRQLRWLSNTELVSVGYDMTVRLWDLRSLNYLVQTISDFTEFVVSVGYDPHNEISRKRNIAVACWDGKVYLI